MSKTINQAMSYEVTKPKVNNKAVLYKAAEQLSTPAIVWLLAKRHKVGLLAVGNVVLVLNWIFPEWPTLVKSLF